MESKQSKSVRESRKKLLNHRVGEKELDLLVFPQIKRGLTNVQNTHPGRPPPLKLTYTERDGVFFELPPTFSEKYINVWCYLHRAKHDPTLSPWINAKSHLFSTFLMMMGEGARNAELVLSQLHYSRAEKGNPTKAIPFLAFQFLISNKNST